MAKAHYICHALLLGDGQPEVQTALPKRQTAPPDIQQTHQDGAFQSDDLLSEVEFELIWLGKKVCTAWCVLSFNLTSSTECVTCTEASTQLF
jgi:hypothetical protein